MPSNLRINPKEYHESIASELDVVQNRVRSLIGSAHMGEDGRYKEAILKSVIQRFLPKNISVGTGFVLIKNANDIDITMPISIVPYGS